MVFFESAEAIYHAEKDRDLERLALIRRCRRPEIQVCPAGGEAREVVNGFGRRRPQVTARVDARAPGVA